MKKASEVLLKVFAVGIILCLFAGFLSLVGYVIALFMGGPEATELCALVFKTYLPWVIRFTTIFVGIGLLGMYLGGKKALTVKGE